MRAKRDVACKACGYLNEDIICDNRNMPLCPECGEVLVTSWHTGQAPGLETVMIFQPLKVGDVEFHTKQEKDTYLANMSERINGHHDVGDLYLEPITPAQRKAELDELKHETAEWRKKQPTKPPEKGTFV